MTTQNILSVAQAYAHHSGLKLSTVGAYAVNDGKFFVRLLGGGGCTLKTAARVMAWFSDNWPSDLEWPRDIPRPKPRKEAA
ncbi:hypothetical protein RNZ50_15845 [Paracoccaceae bacterium Fryx2]|nr:hypothetical protein [Paracoccaceae bacterium Fryx2]